jgi:hypothetical protein
MYFAILSRVRLGMDGNGSLRLSSYAVISRYQ